MLFGIAQENSRISYLANGRSASAPGVVFPLLNQEPVTPPGKLQIEPQYDLKKINKNLNLDRKLIISGSVSAGAGVCSFLIGVGFFFAVKPNPVPDTLYNPVTHTYTMQQAHYHQAGLPVYFSMFMLGTCLVATGVPMLSVGIRQRHIWQKRKDQINIQTGILSNAHLGLAITF
jgi:hypothetical protein